MGLLQQIKVVSNTVMTSNQMEDCSSQWLILASNCHRSPMNFNGWDDLVLRENVCVHNLDYKPNDSSSFLRFVVHLWRFSCWIWAKLSPIYSKRHLQHASMRFFPLASRFTSCLLGHPQKSKFRLLNFLNFFAFPFSPFLFFMLRWLTFYRAYFWLEKFSERIIETGSFYHGVASCSDRKFCSEFSLTFLSILVHISGSTGLITLVWVLLERLFLLAGVEYRWCQFW